MSDPATIRTSPHTPHELRQVLQRLAGLLHVHEDTKTNPHTVTIDQAVESGEGGVAASGGGELLVSNASAKFVILAAGSDGQMLAFDTNQALDMKWLNQQCHIPMMTGTVTHSP